MTTAARQAEADRVELVYSYALAHIGASTIKDALALWQDVPVTQTAATAADWLAKAVHLILTRRGQAQKLALSYYRLVRALRTGKTIIDPTRDPEPKHISLEMLRHEFELLVDDALPDGQPDTEDDIPEPDGLDEVLDQESSDTIPGPEPLDDEDSIETEELPGLAEMLADEEAATQEYAAEQLQAMGSDNLGDKVDGVDPNAPSSEADQTRADLHLAVGAQQAATGARIAMNGARNTTFQIARSDSRIIGWVRQSQTGHPCYWCAMLISRGVLYKTRESAGGIDANKFHDNCYCVAVQVFAEQDITNSPVFAQNRYYNQLWNRYIKGKYSGQDAINQWRKLLDRIRADNELPAQEAG